jgi:putative glutamine amidotransferase
MNKHPPVIGISSCRKMGDFAYYSVYHKYIAVIISLGALPVIIPAVGDLVNLTPLLDRIDGLLLTGSQTNIQPQLYHREPMMAVTMEDRSRDATTMPLISKAIEQGVPIFAICRGMQELNVALGGTLHQELHKVEGRITHYLGDDYPMDKLYEPLHDVEVLPSSWLESWVGMPKIRVNSIHTQAIDELSQTLVPEATAPDGTIEAIRAASAPGFTYGVQWHPEHNYADNPVSQALFAAFAGAVSSYSAQRHA